MPNIKVKKYLNKIIRFILIYYFLYSILFFIFYLFRPDTYEVKSSIGCNNIETGNIPYYTVIVKIDYNMDDINFQDGGYPPYIGKLQVQTLGQTSAEAIEKRIKDVFSRYVEEQSRDSELIPTYEFGGWVIKELFQDTRIYFDKDIYSTKIVKCGDGYIQTEDGSVIKDISWLDEPHETPRHIYYWMGKDQNRGWDVFIGVEGLEYL